MDAYVLSAAVDRLPKNSCRCDEAPPGATMGSTIAVWLTSQKTENRCSLMSAARTGPREAITRVTAAAESSFMDRGRYVLSEPSLFLGALPRMMAPPRSQETDVGILRTTSLDKVPGNWFRGTNVDPKSRAAGPSDSIGARCRSSRPFTPARSSIRAATPPSRSMSWLDDGAFGRAAVPSGASTGEHEALELRDGDERFGGKGVLKAVDNVNGRDRRGARGSRRVRSARGRRDAARARRHRHEVASSARTRCSASRWRSPEPRPTRTAFRCIATSAEPNAHVLPTPMMNVINGGAHADNELELQEFMVMPVGAASFGEALRWGAECFHALKGLLHAKGLATGVGDEGGFAPEIATADEALEWLLRAIEQAGLTPGDDVALAMDPATSELRTDDGRYRLEGADRTADDMIAFWVRPGRPVPDRLDRGRPRPGRLGRLGGAHPRARRSRCSSSATTCSSRTPSGSSGASARASRTRSSSR